jgi:hypothetical protein
MHKSVICLSALVFTSSVALGQTQTKQTAHNPEPDKVSATGGVKVPGWMGRIDPQSEKQGRKIDDVKFVTMGKGFHVTAGPAAIYWNAANNAKGNYSVAATFTQMKPAAHAEGYGLIISGHDLTWPDESYLYFLVRQDGKFLINHRANDSTVHKLVNWTDNAAINKVPDGGKATNALRIDVLPKDVVFLVNGKEVQRLPRTNIDGNAAGAGTTGFTGLRINHNLDVHVDGFAVTASK